ncbi:F-box protein [Acorus gramineus]|uniref:F-box protein n=1 Tax=Acorus gramineus TaxID=55184 RepID=A0AAV9A7C0_ACOGR|nr:F-box protein [Acorus gramineus]
MSFSFFVFFYQPSGLSWVGLDPDPQGLATGRVPQVLSVVGTRLSQRDLYSLLLLSPWCYRSLLSHPSLWQVLDLHEMNKGGERLIAALSLSRYRHVRQLNLEFAQDVEDIHLILLKNKYTDSLKELQSLNLNGCRKISDEGIEAITSACPNLKVFSIYWNVRVTDMGIKHVVVNCKQMVDLNLSGCKNISDHSLHVIADNYQQLEMLNLTRCVKLTDSGLRQILLKCSSLQSLNLYALSSFTDNAYKEISSLTNLRFLDLCGAPNLSDEGLSCIAKCRNLDSLNLTWCVHVTDVGVIAIAEGCTSLQFLSLFGIVGVTDKCLEALSKTCSQSLRTLDVNGCIGIEKRSQDQLRQLFPYLRCFKVM